LRDVGQRLSGALAVPRAEGPEDADAERSPAAPAEGGPDPVTVEDAGAPSPDEPAVPVVAAPEAEQPAEPSTAAPEQPADEPAPAAAEHAAVDAPVASVAPALDDAAAPDPPAPPAGRPVVTAAEADPVLAAAVDLARAAAVEDAGDTVGEHLGVEPEPAVEGDVVATHSFAAALPGYVGWRWAVTLSRAPDQDVATVDEVVLLPGSGALLAPPWVPWSDRVAPGDLGPGDLLPPPEHDPRLVPSYEDVGAERLPFDLHRDLGLGRPRVLSAEGRALAAERWYEGPTGPDTPMARQAPGRCVDCGFLVPLGGELARTFGVCANAVAPDDGRVVALLHGCGAHSETVTRAAHANSAELVVEHEELELVDVAALPARPEPAGGE
jgi:hypothetical protein